MLTALLFWSPYQDNVKRACRDDEQNPQSPRRSCPGVYIQENFDDFTTLIDLLPGGPLPAILECGSQCNVNDAKGSRQLLDHARLRAFLIEEFPSMLQVRVVWDWPDYTHLIVVINTA